MNKRPIVLTLLIMFSSICYAQSSEFDKALSQVQSTIKNYKFDIYNPCSSVEQKSVSLSFKYPTLILSVTIGYEQGVSWSSSGEEYLGTHTFKIPLKDSKFEICKRYSWGDYVYLKISNNSGLTYIFKNKSELREAENISGTKLNLTKLCTELNTLQQVFNREDSKGSFKNSKAIVKNNNTTPSLPIKVGKYIQ